MWRMGVFSALAAVLAALLIGCANFAHHRLPVPDGIRPDKIAVIQGSGPIIVYEVDGLPPSPLTDFKPCPGRYNKVCTGAFQIEVPPGPHQFKVGYIGVDTSGIGASYKRTESVETRILTIEAESGAAYILNGGANLGSWWINVEKGTRWPTGTLTEYR